MSVEFVEVSLGDDDDFQLEANVPLVDSNDPHLTEDVVQDDPEANAYVHCVILRVDSQETIRVQR